MPDTKKHKPKPSPKQPLELYLAKNLSQLNVQVEDSMAQFKTAKFNVLCRMADKLWATIEPSSSNGTQDRDQERTYVLLLRYIRVLRLIEMGTGDKKFVYARFGTKLADAIERWENIRKVLDERYKNKSDTDTLRPSSAAVSADATNIRAIVAKSLNKLKDKPPVSPEFQFMTKYLCDAKSTNPKCLFQLLQDKINILIVDIREKVAYEDSRIKCDAQIINIGGDVIRKGMSAHKLESILPEEIRQIFENRKKYDLLVVLDENSFPMSHIHAIEEKKIYTFLDIINNWDLDSGQYPNGGPVMLQGGYAGWIDHYPTFCINPQSRYNMSNTSDYMDTFMDFDYPAFNYDAAEKKVLMIDRSNKPIYPPAAKKISEPEPPSVEQPSDRDRDTDLRHESDDESDDEEIQYKDDQIFDHAALRLIGVQMDDPNAMCKGLAYLAVSSRLAAKRRLNNLRKLVAFRTKYDSMSASELEESGDEQLLAYLNSLDKSNESVDSLISQRAKYVVQFPYLAAADNSNSPPHGPVIVRADNVFDVLQARYVRTLNENNESVVYIRDLAGKIKKRSSEREATATEEKSVSLKIKQPAASIPTPKIPDRTFQPAGIWIPKVNNINETITGLVNYHNNCFLNATVQALRHVPTMYKYILNNDYKADLKRHKRQPKVQLMEQLAKIVEDLWKCNQTSITAEKLYRNLLEACSIFEDWRHEDGLECFTLLFTRICEETERTMHIQEQYDFYRSDKIEHWIRMHNRQISYLSQRFYYEIKRTRDCKVCNRKMITYDISNSMMLPLRLQDSSGGMYHPTRLDLQEAVTAYMELPDHYKILCTKCKKMAIEYKQIKYYPEVMVINLKRYANNGSTSFYRSDTLVSYPAKNLKIGIAQYRLNAVVCHTGTMEQGHYTALCLNPIDKNWYYYDDSIVTPIQDIHTNDFRCKCYVFYYSLETEFQRLNLDYAKL